jgi:hypothetical protein
MTQRIAGGIGVAILLTMTGTAVAQIPTQTTPMTVPDGYSIHQSVDLGGHMVGLSGSNAMYDTMVNLQSGPRVLGQTFELHALPTNKHTYVDDLRAFSNGFGGDPNNFTKLDFSKARIYEFSGMFRRDRQYFDYDLLGNPNIVPGKSLPIGPASAPTGSLAWPTVNQSPVMFNTVRRMTDTNLTILPLSKVTFRASYSQNVFEGPSLSPSYTIGKYDALLEQYQRNSTDDFMGAIDWKPVQGTKLTFEEQVDHYKADSFFTLNPKGFMVQEADGTPAYLGNWDSQAPYGIGACNAASLRTPGTFLYAPQTPGGMPVIDPACSVVTSYMRRQPTRILYPTEIFRLQSTSIKNVSMNGDVRYTKANMNMPNYYENVLGLVTGSSSAIRSITYNGYAAGHRAVIAADYGIVWQASKTVSLADQVNYSSVQQPGYSNLPIATTLSTPGAPNQTLTYSGPLTTGNAQALPHGINGTLTNNYFGQSYVTNNLTVSWDATPRATFALTYRYSDHKIGEGVPHTGPVDTSTDPFHGTVEIVENGGIFNAALRPTANWDINGTVEVAYNDNAFTPVGPRQTKRYRLHTLYRPKAWATLSGAFNDLERHNNTNNNQTDVASGAAEYVMPIDHVDHSRVASLGAVLFPNDRFGLDFNYSYSDVYTATNICFTSGAAGPGYPGVATLTSSGAPNICPGVFARGSTTTLVDWIARDFQDAPTQYGSVALTLSPVKPIHSDIGYRVSSVNGSQFFNDARSVNGSMVSTYQSPFVDLAWTVHPGLTWKAEYNFYGYGEGGPSGAKLCSTTTSYTATVVPCNDPSITGPTGLTESSSGLTAPRNFHASNVTLGVHYEF